MSAPDRQEARQRRRWLLMLAAIIVLAVGIRVVMAGTVEGVVGPDSGRYHKGALWMLEGKGIRESVRGPMYPLFIAGIYGLFGVQNGLSVQLVQAVCWGGAVGLIGLIGRRLFGSGCGLLAAAFAAVYPPFIKYKVYAGSVYYATEGLFIWCLLLMVWWLLTAENRRPLQAIGLAGCALGLATLTRATVLLFPAAVALWWLLRRPIVWQQWIKQLVVLCLGMWIIITPWMLRNYAVYGAIVPVSPKAGLALIGGNHPYTNGHYVAVNSFAEYQWITGIEDPLARDHAYVQATLTFWRESTPRALLTLVVKKFFLFWTDFGNHYNLAYAIMLPFAWLGLWVTQRNRQALILHAFIFYHLFFCLVFFTEARMRLPIEPFLILLASAGVAWFVGRFKHRVVAAVVLAGWVVAHIGIRHYWSVLSDAINIL